MKKIKLLESLRGLAALLVLFHHVFVLFPGKFAHLKAASPGMFSVLKFISDLNLFAVLFFFVLSGFVIQLSQHNIDFREPGRIRTYLLKRARRILPLYLVALLVAFVLGFFSGSLAHESFALQNLFGNLLFLQTSESLGESWATPYGLNGPLWSLSYEVFFYVVFPFFSLLVQYFFEKLSIRRKRILGAVVAAMVFSFVGFALRYYVFVPYAAFLTLFVVWYGGVYLAVYYKGERDVSAALMFAAVFIILVLFNLAVPSDTVRTLAMGFGIVLAGFALYRMEAFRASGIYQKIETVINAVFYRVGAGSYAIYVLHYPLLLFIRSVFPEMTLFVLLIILLVFIVLMVKVEVGLVRLFASRKMSYA